MNTHWISRPMIMHLVCMGLFVFLCANVDYTEGTRFTREVDENCTRGRCDDGRCPDAENEKCPEDGCGPEEIRCGDTLICEKTGQKCPSWSCKLHERRCADGSCVTGGNTLGVTERCSDGSTPCDYNEKRCGNGECRYNWDRCLEDNCTNDKLPYKCGYKCFPTSFRCDGIKQCKGGEDELECDEGGPSKLWFLLFLLLIPLIAAIIYYCYKREQKYNLEKKAKEQEPEGVPMAPEQA